MTHDRLFMAGLLSIAALTSCASPELRQADRYASEGQWDHAVTAYRAALRKDAFDEMTQHRLDMAKTYAADVHYSAGRLALEEHRLPEAIREFQQAVGLDPTKGEYRAAMTNVLRLKDARDHVQTAQKLQNLGRVEDAMTAFEQAVELDPTLTTALDSITELTKQRRAAKVIGGSTDPITLRFQNAKLKEVFEILARTAGVNVIFDKEVRDEPVTIFIKDLPFDEAMHLILNTNGLLSHPVAPDTILVMPNNKQKQAQYQDLLMRTFYLTNAKAKEAVNLVRTMLESKKIYVDEKVNAILVRDEPAKLQLAEKLLFAIDRREPEVELDVEVLEVNRTKSLKYGLNFAKQAGAGIIPGGGTGSISTAPTTFTYQQLTALGPQSYLFTFPASVLSDFFKQESDAKTLASPKLRVLNNKSASINVGDKQPILLSTTNVLPGQAATGAIPTTSTVTSIEFKDVGVKLTVEPSINAMDEVAMKLKVEVTRLGDQVILQASPEIKQFKFGTRSAETFLMLKDDETVVLAGLIQDEDRKTRSTIPLLGDIPWIGNLFASTTVDHIETEVVLTITPHVVRSLTTPPIASQTFWSGTDTNYATTQLFAPHAMTVSQTSSGKASSNTPVATGPEGVAADGASMKPSMAATAAPVTKPTLNTAGAPAMAAPSGAVPQAVPDRAPVPALVARAPGLLSLKPSDLSTVMGQEFRVDVATPKLEAFTDALVTVSYDPKLMEFLRVGPGSAALSARATDGQVTLTMRRQGNEGAGESILAMLFFHAKAKGELTLAMDTTTTVSGTPGAGTREQALIHVQ
ncbi:MAG: secretin N-terminal domain-containing protein [Nitrospira sp.]